MGGNFDLAQVKKEDKRKRILRTAMKLFAEKGYRNVSLDEIARESKVGKGTIYIYFDSKMKILEESAREVFNEFTENFRFVFERSRNLDEFIENLVERMVENISVKSKIMMLFHKESSYDRERYFQTISDYRETLRRVYERFMRGVGVSFEEFQGVITGFFMAVYMMAENMREDEVRRMLKRVLRCILKGWEK